MCKIAFFYYWISVELFTSLWFIWKLFQGGKFQARKLLKPICCKKRQKIVPGLKSRGPLKDLKDAKLILNESKLFPWSSRISLVPFRTFRVTGQELFLAVSYSKPALAGIWYATIIVFSNLKVNFNIFFAS